MRTLLFLILVPLCVFPCKRRSIQNDSTPIVDRKAILILPGFVSVIKGPRKQRKYFEKRGYDVFIPDYLSRKDLEGNFKKLEKFMYKHSLHQYKEVHVFSYIAGARSINRWIEKYGQGNIKSIVYDRSPLQENAPLIMIRKFPKMSRILFGKMIWDMEKKPYKAIEDSDSLHIGFLIETKGTRLVYKGQKYFDPLTDDDWDHTKFGQAYDDHCYIWINHNELYTEFDLTGPQILHLFKTGSFTQDAIRIRPDIDPFLELKK